MFRRRQLNRIKQVSRLREDERKEPCLVPGAKPSTCNARGSFFDGEKRVPQCTVCKHVWWKDGV